VDGPIGAEMESVFFRHVTNEKGNDEGMSLAAATGRKNKILRQQKAPLFTSLAKRAPSGGG